MSSNDDYFYNPDLDNSFPPVSGPVPDSSLSTVDSPASSHNNNNNPVTDHDNNPHNQSNKLKRLSSGSNSSDLNSNKAKLRQNKSDPSILCAPPVVILQNDSTESTESSGFTFGFEVRTQSNREHFS